MTSTEWTAGLKNLCDAIEDAYQNANLHMDELRNVEHFDSEAINNETKDIITRMNMNIRKRYG